MQKICGNCLHYGTGKGGVGCGIWDVNPGYHETCVYRPSRWSEKRRPPHKIGGQSGDGAFHVLHEAPTGHRAFTTKKGKQVVFKKGSKKSKGKKK